MMHVCRFRDWGLGFRVLVCLHDECRLAVNQYACACACIYASICMCICEHMHVHMCAYVCVYASIWMHVCEYMLCMNNYKKNVKIK